MTSHIHVLRGCSPTPLANYLKALGALRIVSEQADLSARGWWDGECFCLLTRMSEEELAKFFLQNYEPTPLLSPWNKGCGFFKENDPGLFPLEKSRAPRFEPFRNGVSEARKLLDEIGRADAVIRAIKARTKTTAKGFQSEEQRQLLEISETYRHMLQDLQERLKRPDLAMDNGAEIESNIATIVSLTKKKAGLPTKSEVESLKNSPGYKRLLAAADKRFKALKATLIPDCSRLWRGRHAEWLSAAVVLSENGDPTWPSLLGTGGNDGNLDFTNNFMQQLGGLFNVLSESGGPTEVARGLLDNALWIAPSNHLVSTAVGQYQPGAAGGANSSTGFASGNLVNPWDFVLMMEGAVLFASRATKRLDPIAFSLASAPFAVRPHAAGFSSSGAEKAQRGEQWMPLWKQPATLAEIASMLGEARIQIDRQPANRPIDVARAISRLGVARGIDAFVRYGYLERNGQSTLAVSLGRIQVRNRTRAYLIDDLAGWCERIGRRSRDTNAPARLVRAERRLADAVFAALTHDGTSERWQAVLLAAADIEAIQATGTAVEAGPIPALHPDWAEAVADGSAEARLALALGSAAAVYTKEAAPIDSVRHHFLPLDRWGRFQVREKRLVRDPRVVASGRDPIRDLASIVERRLIESEMNGQRRSRLIAAPGCGARPEDLARFLGGSLDMSKLLGLARALMAITWKNHRIPMHSQQKNIFDNMPEECWLAVRLACMPWPLGEGRDIPADLRMVRLLNSGDVGRAVDVACARLRSVGIRPPMQAGIADSASARRWAAALAFPMDSRIAFHCLNRIDPMLSLKKGNQHA